MILHSIMPPEMIFPTNESVYENQMEHSWNGVPLIVEPCGHSYKVIRVMSSNPADYLREDLFPGSYIPFS